MSKPRGVDAKLIRLRALRDEALTPLLVDELRSYLDDKSGLVVAQASEIAGSRTCESLLPILAGAFDRFMIDPEVTDKGCRAKIAIVEALNKLEYDKPDIFLRGMNHVQDRIFGTDNDMAGQLRGSCAFGLVRINHRNVVLLLSDMLLDRDVKARTAAVQALGELGSPSALPLLRYKARTGDRDNGVTAECLSAIIRIEPSESLPFVAEFLHSSSEALQEGAALAIAESRSPEALPLLTDFWPRARISGIRDAVLLAISMVRMPAAIDFVVALIVNEDENVAMAALDSLAIHRHNSALVKRIEAEVNKSQLATLHAKFTKKFGVHD